MKLESKYSSQAAPTAGTSLGANFVPALTIHETVSAPFLPHFELSYKSILDQIKDLQLLTFTLVQFDFPIRTRKMTLCSQPSLLPGLFRQLIRFYEKLMGYLHLLSFSAPDNSRRTAVGFFAALLITRSSSGEVGSRLGILIKRNNKYKSYVLTALNIENILGLHARLQFMGAGARCQRRPRGKPKNFEALIKALRLPW